MTEPRPQPANDSGGWPAWPRRGRAAGLTGRRGEYDTLSRLSFSRRPTMPSTPDDLSISPARADALFASPLQPSDEPSAQQVRQVIAAASAAYGVLRPANIT